MTIGPDNPFAREMAAKAKMIKDGKIKVDNSVTFENFTQKLEQARIEAAKQEAEREARKAIRDARKRRKKSRRVRKMMKLLRAIRKLASRVDQLEVDNRNLNERLDRIRNVARDY